MPAKENPPDALVSALHDMETGIHALREHWRASGKEGGQSSEDEYYAAASQIKSAAQAMLTEFAKDPLLA